MTSRDPIEFQSDLALKMADRLREVVKRYIPSETLRNSIEIHLRIDAGLVTTSLEWPHYWAVYYHDGRGPLRPVNGKYLVYFLDPEDDPRFDQGYPVRASEIKRLELTPEEFKDAIASGKMIVTNHVKRGRARRFIDRLAGRAARTVQPLVQPAFRQHLKLALSDILRIRSSTRLS